MADKNVSIPFSGYYQEMLDILNCKTDPETAKEALARWDAGKSVNSISLGGIGPSYEQCLQIAVFEIIRDCADLPLPVPETATPRQERSLDHWADATLARINLPLGLSGAQWGMAKLFALHVLRDGWRAHRATYPLGRLCIVRRDIPSLPLPEVSA